MEVLASGSLYSPPSLHGSHTKGFNPTGSLALVGYYIPVGTSCITFTEIPSSRSRQPLPWAAQFVTPNRRMVFCRRPFRVSIVPPERDATKLAKQERQRMERSEAISYGGVSARRLFGGETQTKPLS